MNSWFRQLNALIALREAGDLTPEAFEDHKKRLWVLEQALAELGQRIDAAAEKYATNDRFQMRLMEIQIEPDGLDLTARELWLVNQRIAFEQALSKIDSEPTKQVIAIEASDVDQATLSPSETIALTKETAELVKGLRDRLTSLRGERLDADIWSQADEMDDALYRNGTESVFDWRQRVLAQESRLNMIEKR